MKYLIFVVIFVAVFVPVRRAIRAIKNKGRGQK